MTNSTRSRSSARSECASVFGAAGRWIVLLAALAASLGCTRSYYRQQADTEVNCIIDNKSAAVGSAPGQFRIDVDPRSRMYDPNSPDCPPMPPDDPISHQLMHCVDCKPGSPCWRHMDTHAVTRKTRIGRILCRATTREMSCSTCTGAVQLALLQSPEYQEQLENAVPVGARRDVRAVPVRYAVLRRLVDFLHGGGADPLRTAVGFQHAEVSAVHARETATGRKS